MTYKITNTSGTVINIKGRNIAAGESVLTNNLAPYRKALYSGLLTLNQNDTEIKIPTEEETKKNKQKTHKRLKEYFNNVVLDVNNQFDEYMNQVSASSVSTSEPISTESIKSEPKNDTISNDTELLAALQDHLDYNLIKLEEKLKNELVQQETTKKIEKIKNKDEILTSLFHFFIDRKINEHDLQNIKKFYTDIYVTKLLDNEVKTALNNVTTYEELVTVLLNNIYPNFFN